MEVTDQTRDRGDELLPCPKCGKTYPWYEPACGGLICRIICEDCGASVCRCSIGQDGYATDMAIETWNKGMIDE